MYDGPSADKQEIHMPSKRLRLLLAGGLLVGAAASLHAQSLGDVAKKEEERRKATAPAAKTYTNKDLAAVPAPPVDASAKDSDKADADKTAGKSEKTDKPAAKDADKADADKAADKATDKAAGGARDQKYWKDRIDAARLALDRDSGYLDAMQTRINALTTDFVNRDDPAQRGIIERDRQRALAELDRLKKQIVDDRKAITDIEEEARRAGVPPGWLR
jgi:hypothetical protein